MLTCGLQWASRLLESSMFCHLFVSAHCCSSISFAMSYHLYPLWYDRCLPNLFLTVVSWLIWCNPVKRIYTHCRRTKLLADAASFKQMCFVPHRQAGCCKWLSPCWVMRAIVEWLTNSSQLIEFSQYHKNILNSLILNSNLKTLKKISAPVKISAFGDLSVQVVPAAAVYQLVWVYLMYVVCW